MGRSDPRYLVTMKRFVTIARFRARLAAYLRAVREGDELVITDRDRPLVRVVPYVELARKEELQVLEPVRDPAGLKRLRFPPVHGIKTDIVALLLEDRGRR
jgi:prevent-host-death family protein